QWWTRRGCAAARLPGDRHACRARPTIPRRRAQLAAGRAPTAGHRWDGRTGMPGHRAGVTSLLHRVIRTSAVTLCSRPMAPLPPIWVVSLERAPQRREHVRRVFTDAGLSYEIVDAVDGTSLTPDDRRNYSHVRAVYELGRGLTAGELGCALSHLGLLRRLV